MGKEIRFTIPLSELTTGSSCWRQSIRSEILKALCEGNIVILPTETSYMLGADATRKKSMDKLWMLKNRPAGQNISVMFGSIDKAREWVCWSDRAEAVAQRYLPGPLTLILPLKPGTRQYASTSGSLGIRISGNPFLLDLLAEIDFPISATSANRHGAPEPYSYDDCVSPVDVVWDAGKLDPRPPSTILDLSGDQPRILRQGELVVEKSFIEMPV
ncbi:MAG: L-threonylcarbamoyladenylate synthase [bacterium]